MTSNPVVIIPALGRSRLYLADENGSKIKNVWPFELDEKALLEDMKGSLMKMMLFRTDAGFSDKVASVVSGIAEPFALDADGYPVNNIKTALSSPCYADCTEDEQKFINDTFPVKHLADAKGADRIFYFEYNFMGDVFANAGALDALVERALTQTGAQRVDFIVMSTGASVFKAWLKENAVKSVAERVVFITAFLEGAAVVADAYAEKINLENPAAFLSAMGGKAASLAQIAGMLPADVIENVITKSMNVVRSSILSKSTSMLALLPPSVTDAGAAEGVRARAEAFREYTLSFRSELRALEEKGMHFAFVCGKGRHLPEIFASSSLDGDGILDASSASLDGEFSDNTLFVEGLEHTKASKNETVVSFTENFLA